MFQTKVVDKIKHTFYVQYMSKNRTIQEVIRKNMIHPDRLLKMHFACPKMKARINTHTHNQNI